MGRCRGTALAALLAACVSAVAQTITLRLPDSEKIKSLRVTRGQANATESSAGANARSLSLPANRAVALDIRF